MENDISKLRILGRLKKLIRKKSYTSNAQDGKKYEIVKSQ
jgi:hypothetical protein